MKLELKHLAPYLPYDIRILNGGGDNTSISEHFKLCHKFNNDLTYCMPFLRPLSDLTKEIEINGERFVPYIKLMWDIELEYQWKCPIGYDYAYRNIEKLFEWHFDVFGLIEKGLAIDINTL